MFDVVKKILGVAACSTLLVTGLAGCGQTAATTPTNAAELAAKIKEAGDSDNFHMEGNMSVTIASGGMTFDIPVNMSVDCVGDNSHGTMSMQLMGDTESEFYTEKEGSDYIQYSKTKTNFDGSADGSSTETSAVSDVWTKSTVTKSTTANPSDALLEDSVVKNAAFSVVDDGYTLVFDKTSMDAIMKALPSVNGADIEQTLDSLEDVDDLSMILHVDKDYKVDKLSLFMSGKSETSGVSADYKLNFDVNMSKYGQIDAKSVAVPEDVKKSAKEDTAYNTYEDVVSDTSNSGSTTSGDHDVIITDGNDTIVTDGNDTVIDVTSGIENGIQNTVNSTVPDAA